MWFCLITISVFTGKIFLDHLKNLQKTFLLPDKFFRWTASNSTYITGVFKILSNIYDGAFMKTGNGFLPLIIFAKNVHQRCLIGPKDASVHGLTLHWNSWLCYYWLLLITWLKPWLWWRVSLLRWWVPLLWWWVTLLWWWVDSLWGWLGLSCRLVGDTLRIDFYIRHVSVYICLQWIIFKSKQKIIQ